jgi:hypothetical protein
LILNPEISTTPNLFLNGWSIDTVAPSNGVCIHHQDGDIKKISTYKKPLVNDGTHWQVQWSETETNWGVTEGGSSGSPIFNQKRLIAGTLTGGMASCDAQSSYDYYGKMSYHWNKNGNSSATQLKSWLDPNNTGIQQLAGMASTGANISETNHQILNVWPNPVEDILHVEIDNTIIQTVKIMNVDGRILLEKTLTSENSILQVDVSQFPSGTYILLIYNEKEFRTQKIIKK